MLLTDDIPQNVIYKIMKYSLLFYFAKPILKAQAQQNRSFNKNLTPYCKLSFIFPEDHRSIMPAETKRIALGGSYQAFLG